MGQAQICCHESEKAGKLELEELLIFISGQLFSNFLYQNPCFPFEKTGVL